MNIIFPFVSRQFFAENKQIIEGVIEVSFSNIHNNNNNHNHNIIIRIIIIIIIIRISSHKNLELIQRFFA